MNAIANIIESNPVAVLTDAKVYSEFYAQIKAEVEAFEPDLSTATGRKAIASLAYKVARTKTAIDDAGKKLNEDARAQINAVDAQRRKIRDELDELSALARRPLTEWEGAESARKSARDAIINRIGLAVVMTYEDTSLTVTERLDQARHEPITEELFGDELQSAKDLQSRTVATLEAAVARLTLEEADRAELARLRLAAQAKAEEEAAAEAARRAEAKRKADAAEAERIAIEREAEAASVAAAHAAREAREEAQAKIDAANAEAARLQREADARAAADKAAADEQANRDADRAHRAKVMGAAKESIVALGPDGETARKIVLAIVAGEIPNVTLRF